MKAEDVIRQEKYSKLSRLGLICEAMEEYAEAQNKELLSDLEYHVKNRSELTKQLAEVHLYNKKMQKALEIMGVSITKEK